MAETRTCKVCIKNFNVDEEDFLYYSKIGVPPPTLCPIDRKLRRFVYRNDRKLYRRTCDLCKKSIIAVYDVNAPFPVYCHECWWSDKWDAMKYGREFDFSRGFFEQWNELNRSVPHVALWHIQNENSEYGQDTSYNKDCYMLFGADYNRDCFYSWNFIKNKDVSDGAAALLCERCYEITDTVQSQFCTYAWHVRESSDCHFCFDLINCHHCFGSTGLRAKSYYWFNEPLSKEEYEKRFKGLTWGRSEIEENKKKSYGASLNVPRRFVMQRNCEDCTGHNMGFCKNVKETHDAREDRDCKYCMYIMQCKDLYDVEIGYYNIEVCYESQTLIKNCFQCYFSYFIRDSKDYWYCNECYMSSNLFGCVGLHQKKYCILNKEYSKEDYEKLLTRIKEHMKYNGEWGEFFPFQYAPFAYNESAAIDYIAPLSKEEVLRRGLRWKEDDPKEYQKATGIIPETIEMTPDSIVQETLACKTCGKNYRIVPQELRFYRNMRLPVPHRCFDCRHMDRLRRRGERVLYDRTCQKCGVTLKTIYGSGSPEIVYCEKCYLEAVY